MEPTIAEVIGWIVCLVVLVVVMLVEYSKSEPECEMSDYWMDRYVRGKK